eukprot:scaffold246294_cov42-Prasinocladus_malaysianus.AAC.1
MVLAQMLLTNASTQLLCCDVCNHRRMTSGSHAVQGVDPMASAFEVNASAWLPGLDPHATIPNPSLRCATATRWTFSRFCVLSWRALASLTTRGSQLSFNKTGSMVEVVSYICHKNSDVAIIENLLNMSSHDAAHHVKESCKKS